MLYFHPSRLFLHLGLACLLCTGVLNAQDTTSAATKDLKNWRFRAKYNRIVRASCFTPGMSDDEMAGIYLWRGGRNLKMAFSFNMVGMVVASTASWLPGLISENYGTDPDMVKIMIAGVSSGFFLAGLCELITGYSKITKAGIILQHNRFKVKWSGNAVSLTF